jgi:hypothetical protein
VGRDQRHLRLTPLRTGAIVSPIGEYLKHDGGDGSSSDHVAERLRSAPATCTLRIEISGDNDMDGADDHFDDWALVIEVVESAVPGAVTVVATKLE